MRKLPQLFLVLFVSVWLYSSIASAHPGNTAGDGCHYCRTNCSKRGVAWDQRHCHGGTTRTAAPKPTCTANAYYSTSISSCVCSYGYTQSGSRCVKVPLNAHVASYTSDGRECDEGYEKVSSRCQKIKVEEPIIVEDEPEALMAISETVEEVDTAIDTLIEEVEHTEVIEDLAEIESSSLGAISDETPSLQDEETITVTKSINDSKDADESNGSGRPLLATAGGIYYRVKKKKNDK